MEKLVPLRDCVNFYIDEAKQTTAEFARLWGIAFRALIEIGMDVSWTPKTVKLEVLPNKVATLPKDYINWIKIGVHNEFGELALLKVNNSLSKYNAKETTRLTDIAAQTQSPFLLSTSPFFSNYDNGYSILSATDKIYAECTVDELQKVIILQPEFNKSHVFLEYMSSPCDDHNYCIDIQCQEAVIAYLRWKDVISNRNVNLGEKEQRRTNYQIEKKLAKRRLRPFRLQDVDDVNRLGNY